MDKKSLREKCPNTEFFLARIFSHSDWIRRDTSYLSVFSPNVGRYGPEDTSYLDTFHTVKGTAFSFSSVFKYKFTRHWCTQSLQSCLPLILFLCPQPIQNVSLWVKWHTLQAFSLLEFFSLGITLWRFAGEGVTCATTTSSLTWLLLVLALLMFSTGRLLR